MMRPATERFQAKWMPVRVKKTRQNRNLERFLVSMKHETALGLISLCLILGPAGPLHFAAPAAAQGENAEVAFWNSIKDSKSAAEFEAYLQAFPNGVFAPLARLRVRQLGGVIGKPATPAAPKTAGAVDMNNKQLVTEIQAKLFNLNYDVKRQDGLPDDSTREAIREWQEKIEVTVTGELTEALLQRLRESRAPAIWGSIAYTANGTIGRAWNRPNRQDAEDTALAECRRRAGRNADCSTQSAGDAACVAVATYRATISETVYYGARVSLKPKLQDAIAAAMEQCERAERSNGTCASRTSLCADGSHEK